MQSGYAGRSGVVLSPLVNPEIARWLFAPAVAILAMGIATVPFANAPAVTALVVGMIAASASILSPITTYWISIGAGTRQGRNLGRQTAAASMGQTFGSAAGGLLFGFILVPNATFTLTATLVLAGLVVNLAGC
jgi:hypothetical protein